MSEVFLEALYTTFGQHLSTIPSQLLIQAGGQSNVSKILTEIAKATKHNVVLQPLHGYDQQIGHKFVL